ncbi:hypothetical protein ACLESD_03240 [Pyxidicoccus sp. 3LFB2]
MSPIEELRTAIASILEEGSWAVIEQRFATVGLAWREDLKPGWGKSKYIQPVLRDLQDNELIDLGKRCVTNLPPDGRTRRIEDMIWWIEAGGRQEISEVTRLNLAQAFDGKILSPLHDTSSFLERFGFDPAGGLLLYTFFPDKKPSCDIDALKTFGFFSWSDRRVLDFVETLVRPEIRRGAEQAEWVALLNTHLRPDGVHLRESGTISGHATYSAQRIRLTHHGRPKNIIFASSEKGFKPILGLSDALDNDIKALENEETCLIYDDPIPDDGLSWKTLGEWWARKQGIANPEDARRNLGSRLKESLASEPERLFFSTYFHTMRARLEDKLPALLPQVYVHYDPKTAEERGNQRKFLIQRMDFLLLLPENRRVVIEIDGKQHYSVDRLPEPYDFVGGITDAPMSKIPMILPSPRIYADTARSDRELRLRGYEVYRFGGYELYRKSDGEELVSSFLETLFRLHRLIA